MKKSIFFTLLIFLLQNAFAQKYLTKNGYVNFFSSTPIEDIEAKNYQVTGILDAATGDLVFKVLIKSFEFKKTLMKEHFNEKYMESEKLPYAEFKGKIDKWKELELNENEIIEVEVVGDLTIHGVTQNISEKGTLIKSKDNKILAKSIFIVKPEDYNIKIPSLVKENIAKEIEVSVEMNYIPLLK